MRYFPRISKVNIRFKMKHKESVWWIYSWPICDIKNFAKKRTKIKANKILKITYLKETLV